MDLFTRPRGISFPLAPALAAGAGAAFATIVATLPAPLLEGLVLASGLPAVLPMAEPPLGLTARALLFVTLTGSLTVAGTLALWPLLGGRRVRVRSQAGRRRTFQRLSESFGDTHRHAPKPNPISAHEELGAPFLSVRAGDPPARTHTADPFGFDLPPEHARESDPRDLAMDRTVDMSWDDLPVTPRAAPVEPEPELGEAPIFADMPDPQPLPEPAARLDMERLPEAAPLPRHTDWMEDSAAPAPIAESIAPRTRPTTPPARRSLLRPLAPRAKSADLMAMVGRLEQGIAGQKTVPPRGISNDEARRVREILDALRPLLRAS